jgi:hypothetical protein
MQIFSLMNSRNDARLTKPSASAIDVLQQLVPQSESVSNHTTAVQYAQPAATMRSVHCC